MSISPQNTATNTIILTNIQRFSLHDGPGIRTTVFLKGCTLRCPWCSNPENLNSQPEVYVKDGMERIYGQEMSCEELYKEVIKDKIFYMEGQNEFYIKDWSGIEKLPGGVTFSGGEALLQIKKLVPLLNRLKENYIHTAVETSLFVSSECLEVALKYIDLFYVDAKIMDIQLCSGIIHGNLQQYLNNLDTLFSWRNEEGRKKPVVIRIPVIGGYTDFDENRVAVVNLIEKYRPLKVEIIKEHNLGISKYESLGIRVPNFKGVSEEMMERYKAEIEKSGVLCEVCRV